MAKINYKLTPIKEIFDGSRSFEEGEKLFKEEMDEFEKIEAINKIQFKKDLRIMKVCYYLQAFKKAALGDLTLPLDNHYSWCPHYSWFPEDKK